MNFLIVDDDPVICEGTIRRLRNMNSPEIDLVASADSGEAALALMERQAFDALLTDIRMEGMDGLTLIQRARQINPDLICLIVTAYDDFGYARRAIPLGVVDFLVKPCAEGEMRERVIEILARHRETRARRETEHIESQSMDSESCRVMRAKRYVREHLGEPIDMAIVANQLDLSYAYFSRIFKSETGESFTKYLLDQRLEAACRLMLKGERLVEIAEKLGYQNANNLTRSFTRKYGMSPSKWLRKHGQR